MADDQLAAPQPPINPSPFPAGILPTAGMMPQQAPDTNDALQQQLLGATEQGRQLIAEQIARARAAAGQVDPLLAQQQAMNQPQSPTNLQGIPKTGLIQEPWMKMQPVTGQGAGHDILNLLSDIGRGGLLAGLATRPGQAIQGAVYGPGAQRYSAQRKGIASQIDAIQKQQQLEQQPIPSAAGLVYHPITASASLTRAGADVQRAQAYQQYVKGWTGFHQFLQGFEPQKLQEAQRHNMVDEQLRGMGVEVQRERNQVILSLGGQRISVDQAKFDAAVNNKSQGFFDQLFTSLGAKQFMGVGGEDTTPMNVTAPAFGGQQPQTPQTPQKPNQKSKSQGKRHIVF